MSLRNPRYVIMRRLTIFLCLAQGFLFIWFAGLPAHADVTMVREVVVAPKKGSLAAIIGPVNHSANVRLAQADVAVNLGPLPTNPGQPLKVSVQAWFTLQSESDHQLRLTVGFPVSESQYSAFAIKSFAVTGPDGPRTVFQRVASYPSVVRHRRIAGPPGDPAVLLPDVPNTQKQGEVYFTTGGNRSVMQSERIGPSALNNLMVWSESFAPKQSRKVAVSYVMEIPLQASHWSRKQAKGNYKGIWPQEANNLPLAFLGALPPGEYYFFDYFLVSGAAWKGSIGWERVTLLMDASWQGHRLFCNLMPALEKKSPTGEGKMAASTAYVFTLRDQDPKENLYFALARPQSK